MHSQTYLKALDGLRGVSVVMVATTHALGMIDHSFVIGILALSCFFFTSGFIITSLLLQEIHATRRLNVPLFYWRRFFRLMPTLAVYVLVSIVVLAALGLAARSSDIWAALLFYANYHAIQSGFRVIGAAGIWSPLGITWSLAPEAHFYLLIPAVVWSLRKKLEALLIGLCVFVVAVLAWRCYLVYAIGMDALSHYRLYCATDTRMDSIGYGCILAVLFHLATYAKKDYATRIIETLQSRVALAIAAAVIALSAIGSTYSTNYDHAVRYTVESVVLAPLYCALFWRGTAPAWLRGFLENRVVVLLGVMSYSLYLYHFGCIAVVQKLLASAPAGVQVAALVALSLVTGGLSYYLVEAPARRLGAMLLGRFRSPVVSTAS